MKPSLLDPLAEENRVLIGQFGRIQRRCSELMAGQAVEIEVLRGELMRLRARLIMRESVLAFEREDRAVLEAKVPGLPRRAALAAHVSSLQARIRQLLRERLVRPAASRNDSAHATLAADGQVAKASFGSRAVPVGGKVAALEASRVAADLVICQTGCVAHDFHWRVHDQCRRTGNRCVLAEPVAVMLEVPSGPPVEERS